MPQVSFKKVRKFPEVLKRLPRLGATAFEKLVRKIGTSYVRVPLAGSGVSRQGSQINTASITGVPSLRQNGKRVIF